MPDAVLAARAKPPLLRRTLGLDLLDNRYPALHGMRVLAIVSVVQFHVTSILAFEERLPLDGEWVASSLTVFFGMDLFFVLSGFLIGSILLRSLETAGTQRLGRFWLRRAFRTFPSYYVVLTILALTTALTAAQARHLPFEYAYLTNYFPTLRSELVMLWGWSLALEEQFYLIVPLLLFVLHKLRSDRARVALLVVLWGSALAIRLAIFFGDGPWSHSELYQALYFRTHTRFDTLVAGILLAFVNHRWQGAIAGWLARPSSRAALLLPSLGCLWLLLRPWMFGSEYVQLVHVFAWGTITSAMYFAWGLLLLHGDGWVHRALSAPFFRRVATLGYGVYLVHIPLCDWVAVPAARVLASQHVPLALVWIASLTALLLASFAVAYVMHVLIEKPSMWLREKLAA